MSEPTKKEVEIITAMLQDRPKFGSIKVDFEDSQIVGIKKECNLSAAKIQAIYE